MALKLTVLVDNTTYIDRYYMAEPAFSVFIEEGGQRILFDCGYSDAFLKNASKMGIDLLNLDHLIFSHGHADHIWGLSPLMMHYSEAAGEGRALRKPTLLGHPDLFETRVVPGIGEIGALTTKEKVGGHFPVKLTEKPVQLSERLFFLGEIPRQNEFEAQHPIGTLKSTGEPDFLMDDTALAWKGDDGLVIITGCSHAGICNITEHAKAVCGDDRVVDIVGGLHLLTPPQAQLKGTLDYIKGLGLKKLHACHCTDFPSRMALAEVAPQQEVGVGLSLSYS